MIFSFDHNLLKVSQQILYNIAFKESGKENSNQSDTEVLGEREQVAQNEVFIYHITEIIVPLWKFWYSCHMHGTVHIRSTGFHSIICAQEVEVNALFSAERLMK